MAMRSKSETRNKKRRIQRRGIRVAFIRPVMVQLPSGETLSGHSVLLSSGGIGIRTVREIKKGTDVKLFILIQTRWFEVPGRVIYHRPAKKMSSLTQMVESGVAFFSTATGSQLWQLSRVIMDDVKESELDQSIE